MDIKKIKVNLRKRSYEIIIGKGIISNFTKFLENLNLGSSAIIITNSLIKKKLGSKFSSVLKKGSFSLKFLEVPDSEKAKSADVALNVIRETAKFGRERRIFMIALGGGVVGDLAGYVAATYQRGVPYVQVPTTFLSQIDSSIGGKVGIDLEMGKNLIGAFYQPRLVFSDVSVLASLSLRQLRTGLAEAIKYAVIKDRKLFEFLEKNYQEVLKMNLSLIEDIVFACAKIKAKIVELDEKEEKGIRTILNFGHTIGHAIEAASGYKFYTHGEAVALGMIVASGISFKLKRLDFDSKLRIERLISDVGLPVKIKKLKSDAILKVMAYDKKFISGKNRFVLPESIGRASIYQDIGIALIKSAIEERIIS